MAQRARSRLAFHDLSPLASERLVRRDFGSRLRGVNPVRFVAHAGKVVRYLGEKAALVSVPGHPNKLIRSTMPLLAPSHAGVKHPVDLSLRSHAGAYTAANPLERVSVAKRLADGTAVGSTGIKVALMGADVSGKALAGKSVFFANAGPDEDATVTPIINGVELSSVLRSKLSPEQISYRLTLPAGASLVRRAGALAVQRSGRTLASIPAPTAVDAQNTLVPVRTRVAGDVLVLSVPHRSLSVAYPILVDPRILTYTVTRATPGWSFASVAVASGRPTVSGPEPGVLTAPAANYGYGEVPEAAPDAVETCERFIEEERGVVECVYVHSEPSPDGVPHARWEWGVGPLSNVTNVIYEGVSITPYQTEELAPAKEGGTGEWFYRLGCSGSTNREEAPPSTIESPCFPSIELTLDRPPWAGVWWPPEEGGAGFTQKVAPTTIPTTLSVDNMIVIEERRRHRRRGPRRNELLGLTNESEPNRPTSCEGDPVNCATGNLIETQTDLNVPGRGVGLQLTRTYNSQAATRADYHGPFGYGWNWTFGAHISRQLSFPEGLRTETETVTQGNGSTVVFGGTEGHAATAPGVQATLHFDGAAYENILTLPDQTKLAFQPAGGNLLSETDRNGNETTVQQGCESTCLIKVTDPAGRKITLYENAEGLVERATDPMGHTVSYGYEAGDLTSVTYPGESSPRWRFRYDAHHRMTEMLDGRGQTTTNTYDSLDRVTSQTDRRGATRNFEYHEEAPELEGALFAVAETAEEEELPEFTAAEEGVMSAALWPAGGVEEAPPPASYTTTITNEASGAVTVEHFGPEDALNSITRGSGTPSATTRSFQYDTEEAPVSVTDGNGHTTKYTYDEEGNRTGRTDPDGDETKWEYDGKHDVIATTTPNGEHTTIERDSHGNALEVSRPAPGGTQVTEYAYDAYGELSSMTDPLEHLWKYEYDSNGDRSAEIDPEGNKRTFAFNADSQETSTTSARGNVSGADPAQYTTIIERDAQGRVVRVIEPLE